MGFIGTIASQIRAPSQTTNPPAINGWQGLYIANGICAYTPQASTGAFEMTGSATTETFSVPKGHSLLRAEFQVLTSSGTPDPTATTILLQEANPFNGGAGLTIANSGAAVPDDSVVFTFGSSGWPNGPIQYIIQSTAPNTDVLTVKFIVQYIGEPSSL